MQSQMLPDKKASMSRALSKQSLGPKAAEVPRTEAPLQKQQTAKDEGEMDRKDAMAKLR